MEPVEGQSNAPEAAEADYEKFAAETVGMVIFTDMIMESVQENEEE